MEITKGTKKKCGDVPRASSQISLPQGQPESKSGAEVNGKEIDAAADPAAAAAADGEEAVVPRAAAELQRGAGGEAVLVRRGRGLAISRKCGLRVSQVFRYKILIQNYKSHEI